MDAIPPDFDRIGDHRRCGLSRFAKVSDFYQQWMDQREGPAYASRMKVRQQVLEAMLKDLNLPVFGPWEQVAPMLPSLAEVQSTRAKPCSRIVLRSLEGGGWSLAADAAISGWLLECPPGQEHRSEAH